MKNNVIYLKDIRPQPEPPPVHWQINPWPLAIIISVALWLGIEMAIRLVIA